MEHIKNDPELAQEMVQLLGNELKLLRKQKRELEANISNQTLEDENAALRTEIQRLHSQMEKIPASPRDGQEDDANAVLLLKDKLKKERLKYKESEDAFQAQMKQTMKKNLELEDSNQQLQTRLNSIHDETHTIVKKQLTEQTEEILLDQGFDAMAFLENPSCPPDYTSPPCESPAVLAPYKRAHFDSVVKSNGGRGSWGYSDKDLLWSEKSVGHCIVPLISVLYDPKQDIMRPFSTAIPQVGDRRDLFCTSKYASKYYGTYECTRVTTMDFSSLSNINVKIANGLIKCLIQDRKMVPPIICDFVEKLYTSGVLKFDCLVLQCVGYDHVSYETTIKSGETAPKIVQKNNSKPSGSNQSGKGKRDRDDKSDAPEKANKKARFSK